MMKLVYSPHYSSARQQKSRDARRDGGSGRLDAALHALRLVAGNDPDHARSANGMGFAKSDVTRGHRLAAMRAEDIRKNPSLVKEVIALVARYRRQVPTSLKVSMGVSDQYGLFD